MWTEFTQAQRAEPDLHDAETILRTCVHCGFCTATCPTYVVRGDELDSPRGRIYLMKGFLEKGGAPSANLVRHLDRCLTCLSCMTTCPSGVDYARLIDRTRGRIEAVYHRPLGERLLRWMLLVLLPRPALFRWTMRLSAPFKGLAGWMPGRLKGMLASAPDRLPAASPLDVPQVIPAEGARRMRVALLMGCAQPVLRPAVNEATARLLARHGCEVVVAEGVGCCGALAHHNGDDDGAVNAAQANVAAWERVMATGGLDAVVVNASGCGVTIKDYGATLRRHGDWAERGARIAALARDPVELIESLGLATPTADRLPAVALHQPCTQQHGLKIKDAPARLLRAAGFRVLMPHEAHLCCGSAGTYSLFQPEIAGALKERKLGHLQSLDATLIATGNIGCLVHLAEDAKLPVVHVVELLDWATGGPKPSGL